MTDDPLADLLGSGSFPEIVDASGSFPEIAIWGGAEGEIEWVLNRMRADWLRAHRSQVLRALGVRRYQTVDDRDDAQWSIRHGATFSRGGRSIVASPSVRRSPTGDGEDTDE
jgi:hypothetical protein